jgi:hypothetical protein
MQGRRYFMDYSGTKYNRAIKSRKYLKTRQKGGLLLGGLPASGFGKMSIIGTKMRFTRALQRAARVVST